MLRHHTQKQKLFLYLMSVLILPIMLGVFCDVDAVRINCETSDCEKGVTFRARVNEVLTVSISEPESWAQGGLVNQTGNRNYSDLLRNRFGITISSNNPAGFAVMINTASATGALANVRQDLSTDSIPMLTANWTRENTVQTKFWGYSTNDDNEQGTYKAFAKSGETPTEILTSDVAAVSSINLYFGAMADDSITSGTYEETVVINVVTNVAPDEPIYMQDVDEWGESLEVGDEITVRDARDEKEYTVKKMPDGHIWMTQNLDHDIDMNFPYNSSNTDIPSSWNPGASTKETSNTTWNNSSSIESYNPGDLYWTGVTQDGSGNVEDYVSNNGDSHYHLGNYYNFAAALATNDISLPAQHQLFDRSICPAGWTIPRAGTGEDSFYALLDEFGFTTSSINGSNEKAWESPLYFTLSGVWTGQLRFIGNRGVYFTSVAGSVTNSAADYTLFYNGQTGSIDSNKIIGGGQTVRCFTRPATTTLSFD